MQRTGGAALPLKVSACSVAVTVSSIKRCDNDTGIIRHDPTCMLNLSDLALERRTEERKAGMQDRSSNIGRPRPKKRDAINNVSRYKNV